MLKLSQTHAHVVIADVLGEGAVGARQNPGGGAGFGPPWRDRSAPDRRDRPVSRPRGPRRSCPGERASVGRRAARAGYPGRLDDPVLPALPRRARLAAQSPVPFTSRFSDRMTASGWPVGPPCPGSAERLRNLPASPLSGTLRTMLPLLPTPPVGLAPALAARTAAISQRRRLLSPVEGPRFYGVPAIAARTAPSPARPVLSLAAEIPVPLALSARMVPGASSSQEISGLM